MNGSGCKTCPVKPCETMQYRGSTCAAQRAKYCLGDPQTITDKIRSMSDEELVRFMAEECTERCLELLESHGVHTFRAWYKAAISTHLEHFYAYKLLEPAIKGMSIADSMRAQAEHGFQKDMLRPTAAAIEEIEKVFWEE